MEDKNSSPVSQPEEARKVDPNLLRINSFLEETVYPALQDKVVDLNLEGKISDNNLFAYGEVLAQFAGEKTNALLEESRQTGQLSDERMKEVLDPKDLEPEFRSFIRTILDGLKKEFSRKTSGKGSWTTRLQDLRYKLIPQYRTALKVYEMIFPK